MEPEETAMIAVADQVMSVIKNSAYPIHTVVLVAYDGGVEVRSQLEETTLKEVLDSIGKSF